MSVTLAVRLRISSQVLHRRVRDEIVVLDLAGEQYYSLDPVGSRIWELLEQEQTPAQIAEVIACEFHAPLAQVQADLLDLVDAFLAAGLVVVAAE